MSAWREVKNRPWPPQRSGVLVSLPLLGSRLAMAELPIPKRCWIRSNRWVVRLLDQDWWTHEGVADAGVGAFTDRIARRASAVRVFTLNLLDLFGDAYLRRPACVEVFLTRHVTLPNGICVRLRLGAALALCTADSRPAQHGTLVSHRVRVSDLRQTMARSPDDHVRSVCTNTASVRPEPEHFWLCRRTSIACSQDSGPFLLTCRPSRLLAFAPAIVSGRTRNAHLACENPARSKPTQRKNRGRLPSSGLETHRP
jgi:hypothetical protein